MSRQFVVAVICFILPVIDTTVVVYNRVSSGKSPFVGGKDHTTHSLAYLGLSDKKVAIVFLSLSILSVITVYLIEKYITDWSHLYTILFGVFVVALLTFFFITTKKAAQHKKESGHVLTSVK